MSGIVVGYDGSGCAACALAEGIKLGKALDVPVIVAFAYDVNPMGGGELGDYQSALQDHAEGMIAEANAKAQEKGAEIETVILHERAAKALADLAKERDADAIVVGSLGESPLRATLVGSTPHKLLQIAGRPVLVVPEK